MIFGLKIEHTMKRSSTSNTFSRAMSYIDTNSESEHTRTQIDRTDVSRFHIDFFVCKLLWLCRCHRRRSPKFPTMWHMFSAEIYYFELDID